MSEPTTIPTAVTNLPAPRNGEAQIVSAAAAPRTLKRSAIAGPKLSDFSSWLGLTTITPLYAKTLIAQAVSGDLWSQWELFSLMEDSWYRLSRNLNTVRNAVKRITWSVTPQAAPGSEPTPEAIARADLVRASIGRWQPQPGTMECGFEGFIYHALDAMGKGLSVQEILWTQRRLTGGLSWLPRASRFISPRNYGWNKDGDQLGLKTSGSAAWSEFPLDQVVVAQWDARSGVAGTTALLRPLAPYWVGRTFGWEWLLKNAQIFGIPFRWATYDPGQPGLKDTLAEMLENLGAAGWAAFPSGTTLEFKEAVTNAQNNPQQVVQELADKACDILILGQTLAQEATNKGTQALGTVHADVRDEILHGAAWWVADVISYQMVPALLRLNYGDAELAPTVVPDLATEPDALKLAQRDEILSRLGMDLPSRFMHERHQVPEAEPGEMVLAPRAAAAPPPAGNAGDDSTDPDHPGVSAVHAKHSQAQQLLVDRVLEDLTGVEAKWLGGVRPFFVELIEAAESGSVSDADFVRLVERAAAQMPELFDRLDHDAIADALEAAMGAACVNGAMAGVMKRRRKHTIPN